MTLPLNAQWIRKAEVVIGKGGTGLLVNQLKVDFEVKKTLQPSPNTALIKIYNLNPNNENLIKNEFDEVILNAGYENNVRIVFRGNIKHVFKYKDKTDYVTEIEAADGDDDYRNSYLNLTLSAGTTRQHVIDQAVASFSTTTLGYVDVPEYTHIRGAVLSGNTRHVLDAIARDAGANWSIQDGQLTIVKTDGYLPNTAIVVNSNTGMLDAPEVNDKGIGVRCLMNPQIAINGKIQLNNNDIRIRERKVSILSSAADKKPKSPVRLDPDGIYKVIQLVHRGSNRGNDWVTEMRCLALGAPIPAPEDETQGGIL
jgi:hypothetical protein